MNKSSCFSLGHIVKPFGVQGEMLIIIDADNPDYYADTETIFVSQRDLLAPYAVEYIEWLNDKIVLKLEDINKPEEADKLRGCELFLPLSMLPKTEEGEFYLHDLVGCEIIDELHGNLGKVKSIYDLPNNELMAFDVKGKEVLVPIQRDFILQLDTEKKLIKMRLPEGLIEVFTEEDDEKDEG
jgi:16S rRNA processing protein RimM